MGQFGSGKEKGLPARQMLPSWILFILEREKSSFAKPSLFSESLKEIPFSNYSHLHRLFIWRNIPAQGELAEALKEPNRIL